MARSNTSSSGTKGRLSVQPINKLRGTGPKGEQSLGLSKGNRDGLLYIPQSYSELSPAPLVLFLHGAGTTASNIIDVLKPSSDEHNFIILAPDSRKSTWDILLGDYGPDVQFINSAVEHVFKSYAVDSSKIVISGFSDGASYALSLGLMNGDLFTHVMAYSPGFMAPLYYEGRPKIFISHGAGDPVLPIDAASRQLAPKLLSQNYDLEFYEFIGGHEMPEAVILKSMAWLFGLD